MASKLKVVSLNVRGLNNNQKRRKIFLWLRDLKFDIILLQETFCTSKSERILKCSWQGEMFNACSDSSHSRGVAILFRKNLDCKVLNYNTSIDGRKILLNLEFKENLFTIVSIYAPNHVSEKISFFKTLKNWVRSHALNMNNLLIGGDFNCCLTPVSSTPRSHVNDNSRKYLLDMMSDFNCQDCCVIKNMKLSGFTYYDKSTKQCNILDYILMSKHFSLDIEQIKIVQPLRDNDVIDHNALLVVFKITDFTRGPGYWKFNNSLLHNSDFIDTIVQVISDTGNKYSSIGSKRMFWEILKFNIRESSIKYSISKAKRDTFDIKSLQEELDLINKNVLPLDSQSLSSSSLSRKKEIESLLQNYYDKKSKGYYVRSRAKWINEGETGSKYFLNLEKQRQNNNVIKRVKNQKGEILQREDEILNEISNFYTDLYTSTCVPSSDICEYLSGIENLQKITNFESSICDAQLNEKEILAAIHSLKLNKSPGLDGLTPEFYKSFWNNIKTPFVNMLNETYSEEQLPDSLRQAVIALIFKKGNKDLLKNYRPISLCNYDYKILAIILARRLQKVIPNLISLDQTAYIKNRFIGINARFLYDIVEYCENFHKPGILISLDFQKAFDSIEWNFMEKTLETFGFGEKFRKWIKILYTNPCFLVKNNGWISQKRGMTRGIRQGCPVSALLFILCVEILALKLKQSNEISGIKIGSFTSLVTQHADDTSLTLDNIDSVIPALSIINTFSKLSGLKLNMDKTKGIWLGSLKNGPDYFAGLSFTEQCIKSLGIYIGPDKIECISKNWESRIKKFKNILLSWKTRKLTLYGKALIVNMLAMPTLVYNFSLLTVPLEIMKDIEKSIYEFIWGKRHRIKKNTIIGKKCNGGINLVDVESKIDSLKAAWVHKLCSLDNKCRAIIDQYLKKLCVHFDVFFKNEFSQ